MKKMLTKIFAFCRYNAYDKYNNQFKIYINLVIISLNKEASSENITNKFLF